MPKAHRYTGVLAQPPNSAEWDYCEREVIGERLDALFLDFGMTPARNPISFFQLLLKLAERHVPGFSRNPNPPRRAGRPAKRDRDVDLIVQFLPYEKKIAEGSMKAIDAARNVVKARGTVDDDNHKKAKALLKKYERHKANFLSIELDALRKAIAARRK